MNRTAAVVTLLATVAFLATGFAGALERAVGGVRLLAALGATGALLVFAARDRLPRGRGALIALLALTALVRLPLLAAPPTLSDDVHRYVLDGRMWLAGVDPYRVAPAALSAQGSASPCRRP